MRLKCESATQRHEFRGMLTLVTQRTSLKASHTFTKVQSLLRGCWTFVHQLNSLNYDLPQTQSLLACARLN